MGLLTFVSVQVTNDQTFGYCYLHIICEKLRQVLKNATIVLSIAPYV